MFLIVNSVTGETKKFYHKCNSFCKDAKDLKKDDISAASFYALNVSYREFFQKSPKEN